MSITTKTGDNGETSLLTGERVKKSGLRVDTYGTLDEVDSALGLARAFSDKDDVAERILKLQRKLPALMADFASCGTESRITMEDVREIESWCDDVESDLPEEHAFIIPGGSQSGAMLDLARTTARRAERRCKRPHLPQPPLGLLLPAHAPRRGHLRGRLSLRRRTRVPADNGQSSIVGRDIFA